jgi:hypothetical protein
VTRRGITPEANGVFRQMLEADERSWHEFTAPEPIPGSGIDCDARQPVAESDPACEEGVDGEECRDGDHHRNARRARLGEVIRRAAQAIAVSRADAVAVRQPAATTAPCPPRSVTPSEAQVHMPTLYYQQPRRWTMRPAQNVPFWLARSERYALIAAMREHRCRWLEARSLSDGTI